MLDTATAEEALLRGGLGQFFALLAAETACSKSLTCCRSIRISACISRTFPDTCSTNAVDMWCLTDEDGEGPRISGKSLSMHVLRNQTHKKSTKLTRRIKRHINPYSWAFVVRRTFSLLQASATPRLVHSEQGIVRSHFIRRLAHSMQRRGARCDTRKPSTSSSAIVYQQYQKSCLAVMSRLVLHCYLKRGISDTINRSRIRGNVPQSCRLIGKSPASVFVQRLAPSVVYISLY